jgi:hypothetical protein
LPPAPQLDLQRSLGPHTGVPHRVGDQLGHEQEHVLADGAGQLTVARDDGTPDFDSSRRPSRELEHEPVNGRVAVCTGKV